MANHSTTILSNVDPFSFSFHQENSTVDLPEAQWRSLWGSFGIVHFHAVPQDSLNPQKRKQAPSPEDELDRLIDRECRWTPVLKNLGLTYKTLALGDKTRNVTHHTKTSVRRAIFQLAKSYYEEIWQSLTTEEQLALFHLSKNRFIHVNHPGIEPLLRKGLIRFSPDLRLLNASFRGFVRVVGERDQLSKKEAKQDRSLWGKLKWPLGIGFGTILVFLIATQEELRAALPAVIALAPLLLQVLPEISGKRKT